MKLLLFITIFSLFSCSEESLPNLDGQSLLARARKGDPKLRVVVPKDLSTAVIECTDYTPKCRYGYKVIIKNIELKALYYNHRSDALHAAKRIKGYVVRNWVLDDVRGEPILERFVVKYLEAEKAF